MVAGWAPKATLAPRPLCDLLCIPIFFIPLAVPYHLRSTIISHNGISSFMVSLNACRSDEILNHQGPDSHVGYVRLFLSRCGTFHKQGCMLFPVWRECPGNSPVTCLAWIVFSFENLTDLLAEGLQRKICACLCPGIECQYSRCCMHTQTLTACTATQRC
jgi:hypothetical protein